MKKLTILLTGIFVLACMSSFAQVFDKDSPFQFVFDEKDTFSDPKYVAVNFIDTATKEIYNTFNFVENNPYNKLDYPEQENKDPYDKNKIYRMEKFLLNNISLPDGKIVFKEPLDVSQPIDEIFCSSFYYATTLHNFLVVKYNFYLGGEDWVAGRSDAVLIFDTQGNLLHKLNDFDTDVREWALTENGRYFSYAFGGVQDESLEPFCEVGYKIIDLHKNKIAYQENFGYKYSEVRTGSKDNIFVITGFSSDLLYIFIDFQKKKKYSRVFSNEEMNRWKNFTNEGLFLYIKNRNSNDLQFLSFEKDFKVEDLK